MKKNHASMKLMITALLAVSLAVAAVGCSGPAASSSSSSAPESAVSSEVSSSGSSAGEQSSEAPAEAADRMAEEGLTVVSGVLEDVAVNDKGQTVWMLRPDEGADGSALKLVFDDTASYEMDLAGLANGVHLQIAYETPENADAELKVVKAAPVQSEGDMTQIFEGTVKEITPDPEKPGEGQILMQPLEGAESTMEWIFNYSAETTFPTEKGIEDVKTGDRLDMSFNGVATRSIPPQSFAQHILSPDQAKSVESSVSAG